MFKDWNEGWECLNAVATWMQQIAAVRSDNSSWAPSVFSDQGGFISQVHLLHLFIQIFTPKAETDSLKRVTKWTPKSINFESQTN